MIAAGEGAEQLIGQRVAALTLSRGMFAQYATVSSAECVPLPGDISARDGAGLFCNPLTALAIVETVWWKPCGWRGRVR